MFVVFVRLTNQNPFPLVIVRHLPFFQAAFRPIVCKIDKQDKAEKYEHSGTNQGNVIAPKDEKAVRNEERSYYKGDPE